MSSMTHPIRATVLLLTAALLGASPTRGQQLVPGAQGFSFGTSAGRSTFYRQANRSEAHGLVQLLSTNATPLSPEGGSFTITNPRDGFAVIQVRQNESAAYGQTSVGSSSFSGFSYSVFSN